MIPARYPTIIIHWKDFDHARKQHYHVIQSIPRIRCPGAGRSSAHLPQQSTAEQLKRNVSFRPTVTAHPIEKLANNEEARSRMYLSKEKMNEILNKNRDIQLSSNADSALRGPEVLLCPTQASTRLFIKRTVLKYQRKLNAKPSKFDEENFISLAALSAKLSQWSMLVTLEAARCTSLHVYYAGDDLISTNALADTSPFPTTKRRRVTCDNEDDQLAKQRRSDDNVLRFIIKWPDNWVKAI